MTPEERQLLTQLFDRIRGQAGAPRDASVESFIAEQVRAQPWAPYLMAQAVIVQEETLKAADQRITSLEARVRELEAQPRPQEGGFLGGLGKSLFGGAERAPPAPAQPQDAPPPAAWRNAPREAPPQPQQGGPWAQPQAAAAPGGGFLKGALGAAAGVAGGMLLANSLSGLFSSGHGSSALGAIGGQASGAAAQPAATTVNNYYGDEARPQQAGDRSDAGADYQDASYDDGGFSDDGSYDA